MARSATSTRSTSADASRSRAPGRRAPRLRHRPSATASSTQAAPAVVRRRGGDRPPEPRNSACTAADVSPTRSTSVTRVDVVVRRQRLEPRPQRRPHALRPAVVHHDGRPGTSPTQAPSTTTTGEQPGLRSSRTARSTRRRRRRRTAPRARRSDVLAGGEDEPCGASARRPGVDGAAGVLQLAAGAAPPVLHDLRRDRIDRGLPRRARAEVEADRRVDARDLRR